MGCKLSKKYIGSSVGLPRGLRKRLPSSTKKEEDDEEKESSPCIRQPPTPIKKDKKKKKEKEKKSSIFNHVRHPTYNDENIPPPKTTPTQLPTSSPPLSLHANPNNSSSSSNNSNRITPRKGNPTLAKLPLSPSNKQDEKLHAQQEKEVSPPQIDAPLPILPLPLPLHELTSPAIIGQPQQQQQKKKIIPLNSPILEHKATSTSPTIDACHQTKEPIQPIKLLIANQDLKENLNNLNTSASKHEEKLSSPKDIPLKVTTKLNVPNSHTIQASFIKEMVKNMDESVEPLELPKKTTRDWNSLVDEMDVENLDLDNIENLSMDDDNEESKIDLIHNNGTLKI